MASNLCLHKGARLVTRPELDAVPTPPSEGRFYPTPFSQFLDMTVANLQAAGFEPERQQLALSRHDLRFFAVIDTKSVLVPGTALAVAISSAHDRSLCYRYVAGNRTFCCDNLMMSGDLSQGVVRKKHTRFGSDRMAAAIQRATKSLPQFVLNEAARLKRAQETVLTDIQAESLILRSHEQGVISNRYILRVLHEFRAPSFEEFEEHGKSLYRLEQAFTTCLGEIVRTAPQEYTRKMLGLQRLLSGQFKDDAPETVHAA